MKKPLWFWITMFSLLQVQQNTHALMRFERFIPANPTADDVVQVEIWFSGTTTVPCDSPANPSFPTYLDPQSNGALRFRFSTVRAPTSTGTICFAGVLGPFTARYSLGRLAARSHQLELYAIDMDSPVRPDIFVADVPLVVLPGVTGTTFITAPTMGSAGGFVMVLSILLAALAALKVR
jgi:hypothetical protein